VGDMNLKLNVRHLELLELIPIYPKFLTVSQLAEKLTPRYEYKDQELPNIKRNLQRDLKQLEVLGITQCGDSPEGLKWSLVKDSMYLTAQLSPADALCFAIIERFIQPVMPNVLSPYLTRVFEKSSQLLNDLKYHNSLKSWLDKVIIENKGQPLVAAKINNKVRIKVYDALLAENKLEVEYRNKSGEFNTSLIYPLGLVVRSHIQYLIVQYCGYDDVRMLAMNRIVSCRNTSLPFDVPADFNLKEYVSSGNTGLLYGENPINFEGVFSGYAAEIILETPISENQQTSPYLESKDKVLVKATLNMNYDFEIWLLGLANHVKVLQPISLQNLMREKINLAAKLYS
jgi:hypothetical protein